MTHARTVGPIPRALDSLDLSVFGHVGIDETGVPHVFLLGHDGRPLAVPTSSETIVTVISVVAKSVRLIIDAMLHDMLHDMSHVDPPHAPPPMKKKERTRAPNPYNNFIGEHLREIAKTHPRMPRKERMQSAITAWQALHPPKKPRRSDIHGFTTRE